MHQVNSKPSHKMSSVLNELRLNGHFCDLIIKVGETEFPAHKLILSNFSPYFRALFTQWSEPDQKVFHIPGLSADTMQLLLDYAYTSCLSVTEENVREVMLAADQFNAMDVIQSCCDFLEKTLSPKNCIGIWQLTKICFQLTLHSKAYKYIIEHFEEVVAYRELLQLSVEELSMVIEKDDHIVREEFVWEAVLKWIRHAPQDRQGHVATLLSKVRLAQLGRDYIQANLLTNDLIRSSTDCMAIITSAIKIPSTIDAYCVLPCSPLCCPRLPSVILLAVGGWYGGAPTNSIEAYDVRADRWTKVTNNLESPRAYHGTAFLNGYVYCIGGFDRAEHFNSVCRFDPRTHTWSEVSPMYYRRSHVSVTVLNGCIYAMGGYDGHTRLNTAEYYRPEINQWSNIAPMHEQRYDASCTVFHDRIYICGGFNGYEYLQTAEYYSPDTNQWTIISPMNSRRGGPGVCAYADRVYVVGGFDGINHLCTAEAYNTQNDTWENVPSMTIPRSNFGIEVIEDKLFAVGGYNGFTSVFEVECYNAKLDQWSEADDMNILRKGLSCCVLSGLPNMAEYSMGCDAEEEMESEDSS
ncbi:kelch-like protein 10 [Melanotaenia boesemani]|uniref:kelch-like protein 10 n=1 Tax=Melanotaenia boesemani TaxID=1250792 RepID=UPI001C045E5C|nr:kelch-like protein 10 [Melanotaenia boesemani]